jgi:hypothetical protein
VVGVVHVQVRGGGVACLWVLDGERQDRRLYVLTIVRFEELWVAVGEGVEVRFAVLWKSIIAEWGCVENLVVALSALGVLTSRPGLTVFCLPILHSSSRFSRQSRSLCFSLFLYRYVDCQISLIRQVPLARISVGPETRHHDYVNGL